MAELPMYRDMRIEVLNLSDELLFEARVCQVVRNEYAQIEKIDGLPFELEDEHMDVRLRGYNVKLNRGVWLQGAMHRFGRHSNTFWLLDKLRLLGENAGRTFTRASYSAAVGKVWAADVQEALEDHATDCKVTNISYGGAALRTAAHFAVGDFLLLEIRVRRGKEQGPLLCVVRRATERDDGEVDYGCEFISTTRESDDRVIRTILEVQMMGMPNEIELPPPYWRF